ncbi:hypothetical protein MSAN_00468700 [Mycena sanguinolenta]|uniref:CNH domain-containing protein n=1 Tax=Mycena sanguinolenta TaxID=230812 RepID=A0A8H7DIQ8_9AGAR|nr:hypothetical protein MSAN_00468700 [Mycena sanguinolenta]
MDSGHALILHRQDSNKGVVKTDESSQSEWQGLRALALQWSPLPGRTLGQAYTSFGAVVEKRANRAAHGLGLGPHAVSRKIQSHFGDGEERLRQLELLRTLPSPTLERWCLKLMKYSLPTESINTQCQAFKEILTLVTLFPGLRPFLLHTEALGTATSIDAICTVWNPAHPPVHEGWTFWKRLAAMGLIETSISAMVEQSSLSDLCDCQDGALSIIERLLIERNCSLIEPDCFSEYRGAICVRYLGGILCLPRFWMNRGNIHDQIAEKLLREMAELLKDIIEANRSCGDVSAEPDAQIDYDGVDVLASALLAGISGWFSDIDKKDRRRQSWHGCFTEFIQLLRQPRTAESLPSAFALATNDFEDIVPFPSHEAFLHKDVDGYSQERWRLENESSHSMNNNDAGGPNLDKDCPEDATPNQARTAGISKTLFIKRDHRSRQSGEIPVDHSYKSLQGLGDSLHKVFELKMLSSDTFFVSSLVTPGTQPALLTGKVTCFVPFDRDGEALVAVGCATGVWIGLQHNSQSMQRVLRLKMVTQCAMLEDLGVFLVLADKTLFAYRIEALLPRSPPNIHAPERLGTNIHFFRAGSLLGRTLVILMERKYFRSLFRVLEPDIDGINGRTNLPASTETETGSRSHNLKPGWFRIYRDFYLPSEAFDIEFLQAKIVILCKKGFEIMDLEESKRVRVPQAASTRQSKLAKRCDSCRPMGMFRATETEFLLCYNEFGLYVDRRGDLSGTRASHTVQWEGTAKRVAFHAPYVLLFTTRFIEVRDTKTGQLAQIIPGNGLQCLWDGRWPVTSREPLAACQNGVVQEARVYGVMNGPQPSSQSAHSASRSVYKHLFQRVYGVMSRSQPSSSPGKPRAVGQHVLYFFVQIDMGCDA